MAQPTDRPSPPPPPPNEDEETRPLVVVLGPFQHAALSQRFRILRPSEFPQLPLEDFLAAHAQSARAVLSSLLVPVDARTIACLPRLECVVTTSSGVDHIDLDACRRRGIAVANSGPAFSEAVAEYAVGMLVDVLRRISAADRYVRGGMWSTKGEYPLGHKVSGKRVGILGFGRIGSLIAKMLEGFGCKISYHSRTKKPLVAYEYFPTVLELAAQNDVLIVCCSFTNNTRHIISRDILEALGKDGVIINVGRGMLIDEPELVRCLREGVIRGAGLDVFEDEPRVPQELFEMDNVVLSPHVSVVTEEALAGLMDIVAGNLEAFFAGKPLLCPVPL